MFQCVVLSRWLRETIYPAVKCHKNNFLAGVFVSGCVEQNETVTSYKVILGNIYWVLLSLCFLDYMYIFTWSLSQAVCGIWYQPYLTSPWHASLWPLANRQGTFTSLDNNQYAWLCWFSSNTCCSQAIMATCTSLQNNDHMIRIPKDIL